MNLRHEIQHVRWDLSTVEHAATGTRDLAADRAKLLEAVGRVYTHPAQVVERLTADPRASERLRTGHAAVYGCGFRRSRPPIPMEAGHPVGA
jgi:hypothetical protein